MVRIPPRYDFSSTLIHLMKGESARDAFSTLSTILAERILRGGDGFIVGSYRCVCFSEAPISALAHILANPPHPEFRYQPFGIMVSKKWLAARGGRPVIYQPRAEADDLPEQIKYRHVTFDPNNGIDFTWEREWRVRIDELPFTPEDVTVVLPSRAWTAVLVDQFTDQVRYDVEQAVLACSELAHQSVQTFPWNIIALSDLGIEVQR